MKPTNYVYSSYKTAIRGTYVLDPSLPVPSSLLPPIPDDISERKTFLLETKNGGIATDVYLVNSASEEHQSPARATILIRSKNGPVNAKLVFNCPFIVLTSSLNMFVAPRLLLDPALSA
jgi:hypothetical protein